MATEVTTAGTVIEALARTAEEYPDVVAVRTRDGSTSYTWSELATEVRRLAAGLAALGVRRGDTVALMFANQPEFHLADLAVVTLGATPFSIYTTSSPEQIRYVVEDAGARVAMLDASFAEVFAKAADGLPGLEHLVVAGDGAPEGAIAFSELASRGEEGFEPEPPQPEDVLTLIYTSGTTGPPKGVEITHANIMSALAAVRHVIEFPEGATKVISWLPNAHIAERTAHHYVPIRFAGTITCCDDPRTIGEVLAEVRPTWFFAVPRIWEKIKAKLEATLAAAPEEQRAQASAALDAAKQKVRLEQAGQEVPEALAAAVAKADDAMFVHLRRALGLDEAAAVNVGAAPTPVEVLEFFHAIGIPVAELWGMSETCGAGTVNPPAKIKIGTVGPPTAGGEIRLAEDGEVLIRAPFVMRGYRNQPEKTAEAVDPDGWLHTGDIGEFDDDGYLRIVDRKKELIINAAGKNMSPANIEATIKSSSPLIGQCAVIGDGRRFNTALLVLDSDFAPGWAQQQGIEDTALESLATDERMRGAIEEAITAANERLARVEQIKRFHIVTGDWAPGGDELTPTMKLKRKPIEAKYAEEIDALYE